MSIEESIFSSDNSSKSNFVLSAILRSEILLISANDQVGSILLLLLLYSASYSFVTLLL